MTTSPPSGSRRRFLHGAAAAPLLLSEAALSAESPRGKDKPATIAVVTGGHSFDVVNFHKLFRGLAGINAVIQHMDDYASSSPAVRAAYDAVLFYIMLLDGPKNEGHPWYAGRPREALEQLGSSKQGIFVLHHALLAYPNWPVWTELTGLRDRKFGYFIGQKLRVNVVNPQHPIARGLKSWDMIDETYTMVEPESGSRILLTVDHPQSMKAIGWTRQYRKSPVFCYQSGHDNQTWVDSGFREVLRRGLLWCVGQL